MRERNWFEGPELQNTKKYELALRDVKMELGSDPYEFMADILAWNWLSSSAYSSYAMISRIIWCFVLNARPGSLGFADLHHLLQASFVLCRLFKKDDGTLESSNCVEVEGASSSSAAKSFPDGIGLNMVTARESPPLPKKDEHVSDEDKTQHVGNMQLDLSFHTCFLLGETKAFSGLFISYTLHCSGKFAS